MMTKTIKIIAIVSIILTLGVVIFFQSGISVNNNALKPTGVEKTFVKNNSNKKEQKKNDTGIEDINNVENPIHYSVKYKVRVLELDMEGKNKPLMEMQINLDFALSMKANEHGEYTGLIYNVSSNTLSAEALHAQGMPEKIGFTFTYNRGVFSSVNTLGLSDNHPMASIKVILPQMTFSNTIQELVLSDSKNEYEYFSQGDTKSRVLLRYKAQENLPYKIANIKEEWQLILDENMLPKYMLLVEEKHSKSSNNAKYQTLSNVHVSRKSNPVNMLWDKAFFTTNINDKYNQSQPIKLAEIKTKEELMAALGKFKTQGSKELATAIGNYIITHLGESFVFETILDKNFDDQQKSVLIYALQEANVTGGEPILNALSLSEEIDEQNRLRAIISSAYRGDKATAQSLDTMSTLLAHDNINIANTALLNIGNLGKLSLELHEEINIVLKDQIESFNDKYVVMRSIENMGSTEYNDHFTQYLGSNTDDLKKASASLLAKSDKHRHLVVEQMLRDDSVIGTKSMVQGLIKSGNTELSNINKAKLNQVIVDSLKNNHAKYEQLIKLYLHDVSSLTSKERAFLNSLNSQYELPDDLSKEIDSISNTNQSN